MQQRAALRAEIDILDKKIAIASRIYNSKDFKGSMLITATNRNEPKTFSEIIPLSSDIPELRELFNQWGARMIGEKLIKKEELRELENTGDPIDMVKLSKTLDKLTRNRG